MSPVINTDMREMKEIARRQHFESSANIPANNVQTAIEAVYAAAIAAASAAPGFTPTTVTFAMSPYTPLTADTVLLVDTTGGAVVITLPLASTRQNASGYIPLTIKDDKINAAVNSITVNRTAPDTIDGLTTYPMDANGIAATFMPKAAGGYDVV